MELLDRYLKAVANWLPQRQSADLVAEIAADIEGEADEREQGLGRPLTRTEEEAILTRWGHPMLVASRYQPQDSLIGPALLPTYVFVLKLLALVYCLPWFLVWVGFAIADPAWRARHADLVVSLGPLAFNALFLFALVTGIFAAVERRQRANRSLETWTARELTEPRRGRDWREIPLLGSILEIAIGLAAIAWWSGLAGSPTTFVLDAMRVTWTPIESGFYWTLLALMVADVAMATANILHPRWTLRRLGLQIGLDAVALMVVLLLVPAALVHVVPGAPDPDTLAVVARWVNLSWRISLVGAALVFGVRLAIGIRRLSHVNAPAAAYEPTPRRLDA